MAQNNAAHGGQEHVSSTPELKDKILFTLLCLLIYRIGAHITAPGVDVLALTDFFSNQQNSGGLLGLYDLFTGGQLVARDGVRARHHAVHLGQHLPADRAER